MDITTYGPLVGQLLRAGAPMISTALQMAISEIPIAGGIIGPLAGMAAPNILSTIATRLGAPQDATPDQLADKIAANPDGAKDALASLEEQHSYTLATTKQADDTSLARQKQTDETALAGQAQQVAVDTVEAQNPSMFVGGWRPALAWGLVVIMLGSFVLPYLVWVAAVCHWLLPDAPKLDAQAFYVLTGLLGLTVAARSVDKATGTAAPTIGGIAKVVTTKRTAAR